MRARAALVTAALGATLLLAGCDGGGPGQGGDPAPAPTDAAPATGTPDDPHEPNPVIADDFPDPDMLEVDGVYYAYATNGNNQNVRLASSTDLVTWEPLPDALPELPSWVIPGKTWAPEVTELEPGRYVMYFTATSFRESLQCIGVATADSPEGPFTVVGDEMLLCPPDEGGAIDAATFRAEDDTLHLLWKNDGNCCGHDTWIYRAALDEDGTALAEEPVRLIKQDLPWEGDLVEAPTLLEHEGTFTLLYSANGYGGPEYTIGIATAPSLEGPWTKDPDPFFSSADLDGRYVGPGGQDVILGPDGEPHLLFHSWYGEQTYRGMNLLPLTWEAGRPALAVG
ncbi:family 43 glycosylhydrolase [Actinotalea sp. BY-33]|uniref:Family 43 glycosylhydrolase n=1 Tax=Actinotalea soli TaxID=2819234 RepID=A0A939LNT0_9CELL|nr:glycoside hydrolase family 43 protein [Actinotalea soli]MBO1751506.1 family 43 glycosylhydrolase [Actinotalea soli]